MPRAGVVLTIVVLLLPAAAHAEFFVDVFTGKAFTADADVFGLTAALPTFW